MAKIAPASRVLARGTGWSVRDVVCTSGPQDRPFEEQHAAVSISIVAAGTFEYRSTAGRALMTPGSLLLGNAGHSFECSHEHGTGDRCVSFQFEPDFFEEVPRFRSVRLPAVAAIAPFVAKACAGLSGSGVMWEDLAVDLADRATELSNAVVPHSLPSNASARVTRAVRRIESESDRDIDLRQLAQEARLSVYHFLRTFRRVTGVTPHQFLLRTRLRRAAIRLASRRARIIDVALDCGFGDVSNFNRSFRAEFGVSPRAYGRS